ncbi:MAG: hypothetical protein HZC55_19380 [Verrucomicrobia bacterium]|nr:hypothetical protein [Verrucomicrobiota bacterium]
MISVSGLARMARWAVGLALPLAGAAPAREASAGGVVISLPALDCDHRDVREAFRIALGDIVTNIRPYVGGINESAVPVLLAGLRYPTPWTRDSAVNAWNGLSLIAPGVAANNFRAVLQREDGRVLIGGEYWDAVVWIPAAWHHYLCTGDRDFLAFARQVGADTLRQREENEYDAADGLFRGPGWSDGVAAYPDRYAQAGRSAILAWLERHPDKRVKPGVGFPMKALSTNCLYFSAYQTMARMERALGRDGSPAWDKRAARLKDAINRQLWNEAAGNYRFFVDPEGPCELQEGLGAAYAILFGIADARQAASVFARQHVTPAGLPCGWPNLPRYERPDGQSFGRHIGTVWPQIQGFWAEAAARHGRVDLLQHELFTLARHAVRDLQFAELYHPLTGESYGGLQEGPSGEGIILWESQPRQSWAATAFVRMVLHGVVGLRVEEDGLRFAPCVPPGLGRILVRGLRYRERDLSIEIDGQGTRLAQGRVDGRAPSGAFVPAPGSGPIRVELKVSD